MKNLLRSILNYVTIKGLSFFIYFNRKILLQHPENYLCPICGNPRFFSEKGGHGREGIRDTCGNPECASQLRKQTNISKGGHSCSLWREDVKGKVTKSFIKNWGVTAPGYSKEIQSQIQKTNQILYGCDYPFQNDTVQKKCRRTAIKRYGAPNILCGKFSYRLIINKLLNDPKVICKRFQTMKKNGTIGHKSAEEDILFKLLLSIFPDVKRQYYSNKYPFHCDFYIPSKNLYIEYQGTWLHGGEPYNSKSKEHKELIKNAKEKGTKLYDTFIRVWTKTDPLKREIAKKNNLNWMEFFTFHDFHQWILNQRDSLILDQIEIFLQSNKVAYRKKRNHFYLYVKGVKTSNFRLSYISPERYNHLTISSSYFHRKQQKLEQVGRFDFLIQSYEWI